MSVIWSIVIAATGAIVSAFLGAFFGHIAGLKSQTKIKSLEIQRGVYEGLLKVIKESIKNLVNGIYYGQTKFFSEFFAEDKQYWLTEDEESDLKMFYKSLDNIPSLTNTDQRQPNDLAVDIVRSTIDKERRMKPKDNAVSKDTVQVNWTRMILDWDKLKLEIQSKSSSDLVIRIENTRNSIQTFRIENAYCIDEPYDVLQKIRGLLLKDNEIMKVISMYQVALQYAEKIVRYCFKKHAELNPKWKDYFFPIYRSK